MVRSILLLAAVGLASASADKTQKIKVIAGQVLSFASASAPLEHKQLNAQVHKSLAAGISSRSPALFGRQTGGVCDLDQEVCDDGCMPIGDVCCNDGSGYCPATYTCNDGQTTCSPGFGGGGGGDGGDDDDDSDSGSGDVLCDLDEEECDGNCMPIGSVCCNDGSGWCQANYTCDDGLSTCSPVLGGGGDSGSGDDDEGDDDDTGSDLDFCDIDQEACDDGCMPLGSVCCNDGSGYCMENYTCDDGLSTCSPAFGSGGGDDDDNEDDDEDDAFPTLPSLTFPTATATSSSSSRTPSETDSTSTDTSDGSGSNDDTSDGSGSNDDTSDGNDESGSNDVDSGDNNNDNDGGSGAGALMPSFLAGVLAVAMVPLLL